MKDHRNSGEYHRADPAYRRQVLVVLVLAVLVALGALVGLQMWLSKLGAAAAGGDSRAYEEALRTALAVLCFVLAGGAAGFAGWLFHLARATRAERRWPPSNMRTSADVRIRYLTSADSLVAQMQAGALGLVLLALALAGWGGWLLRAP